MKTFLSNIAKSDHHQTPQRVKQFLKNNYDIDITKCFDQCIFNCKQDGLKFHWYGKKIYVNPPYSLIEEFVKRADHYVRLGKIIYFLFPLSKTDKPYFHNFLKHYEMIYCPFRLKFEGSANPSFQTHCLVVMK